MKFVEISASLGDGLKRYNVLTEVSMEKQPFTAQERILYGVTKGTDIIQTNTPTNILVDKDYNPVDDSEPVYFGIRVYPFISEEQQISCDNNNITYGEHYRLNDALYFLKSSESKNDALLPDPYTGELYTQPTFVGSLPNNWRYTYNHQQAMQQFINDCVFPTKPNLDIPGQTLSSGYYEIIRNNNIPYFNPEVVVLSELNQREPRGILSRIKATNNNPGYQYKDMIQFDGQNLNFKFGMAVNSDFAEPPKIFLPYLYRTYCVLKSKEGTNGSTTRMGVIMQCLLYDSNGNVISA